MYLIVNTWPAPHLFLYLPYYIRSNLRCICNNMLKYNFCNHVAHLKLLITYFCKTAITTSKFNSIEMAFIIPAWKMWFPLNHVQCKNKLFWKEIKITTTTTLYSTLNIFYCQATIQTIDQTQVINWWGLLYHTLKDLLMWSDI